MPHKFVVKCYGKFAWDRKAKVGDVVYLKARPDIPMSVVSPPFINHAASTSKGKTKVRWMKPDGTMEIGEFLTEELSL